MGLILHTLTATVQHCSRNLFALVIALLPNLLLANGINHSNCTPVEIISISAAHESQCEQSDGSLEIVFSDPNLGKSEYTIALEFDGRLQTFSGFTASPIVVDRLKPGDYNNITVNRIANNCESATWTQNRSINFGCDFQQEALNRSVVNCPDPITFTDCDGNSQTLSNLPEDRYTNVVGGASNCFIHINSSCAVDEVFQVKCLEASQSTPPLPAGTVTFTAIDYLGAGITPLEAARVNWIIENYNTEFNNNAVTQAIWEVTGTGACSSTACQDIADAATSAIQSPNGTAPLMRFFQPSVSNIQVFVEWEFYPPTCDNVTDAGEITNPQSFCGSGDPELIGSASGASGGSGALEYQWLASTVECPNDLAQYQIPGATGLTYDPEPITESTWYVRCARRTGCTIWIESNCIFIAVNPEVQGGALVSSDYNGSQISCPGAADGEATAIPILGKAPFEYLWSDGQTTDIATGLSEGNYNVTITDDNNCSTVATIDLVDPSSVEVNINITTNYNGVNISCADANDAALLAAANGGTGAISYTWNNGQTTPDLADLGPGTYTVIASDINGCTGEASITLEEPQEVVAEASIISDYNGAQISCNGANDGIAIVTTSGGVPPYTYNWDNGESTAQISGLAPGTYMVTVTDINNCSTTAEVSVAEPSELTCSATVTSFYLEGVDISTLGGNDGSAAITGSGGTGTYTYQWDDANAQTTQAASDLTAGTYNVQISDANGCTCSASVTLLDPAKIGDKVFEDLNGNGIQDVGEPGVEGALITLTGTAINGTQITRSTASDSNGDYMVDGLLPGTYKITLNPPSGYEITYPNEGGDEAEDSDVDPDNGMSNDVTVNNGEYNQDLDAGLIGLGAIGNYTFLDCNKNGIQDTGEEALGFVPVTLNGQTGNGTTITLTTASLADGSYEFINLKPGTYTLSFAFPSTPTGLGYSPQGQGGDPTKDSDVDNNGLTVPIVLKSKEVNNNIDAGFMDITGPTIETAATDLIVQCDGAGNTAALNDWLDNNGDAIASDNYSSVGNITWANNFNQLTDLCGETGSVTVTFTATDECGNNNTTTATFTIEDNTAPTINTPASNLLVECDGAGNISDITNWLAVNGNAAASDICGNVSWSNNYSALNDDCGATGTTTVVFTATDECGNTSETTATITIQDTSAPAIGTPAQNLTVECDGQGNLINLTAWVQSNAGAAATDICGSVTWTNNFDLTNLSDLCGGTGSVSVTFTATDECGNASQTTATLTIEDTTPPSIGIPASNATVECDGAGNISDVTLWLESQGGAGATDLCGTVTWSNNYATLTDDCGATGTTEVTFTATDECGNTSQTTATLTVIDNSAPVIASPAVDQTVECDGLGNQINIDAWLTSNAGALATDVCGQNLVWSNDYTGLSDLCGGTGTTTVIFTVTDECDNTSQTAASFTIIDSSSPSIGIPASNLVVECDGAGNTAQLTNWLSTQGGAGALDICGSVTWSNNYTTLTDECANTGSAEVIFTATDECGNSSQTTATFTITDNTPPNILTPAADLIVECDGQGNQINLDFWLGGNAGALASDQCGGTIAWSNNYTGLSDLCGDTGSATVTFTATDECGNINQTVATFTVTDSTAPSIGIPAAPLTVECDGGGNNTAITNWLNAQGGAGATDLCGTVVWSNDYAVLTDECGATGTTAVTFTATDACGNTSQTTTTITIIDTTPPTIASPAVDQLVECDGAGNQINIDFWLGANAGALATDLCGTNITWTNDYAGLSDECGGTGSATVTFTAADECGNTATTTATITVIDSNAPDIGIPASDLVVECDGAGNATELTDWLNAQGGAGATDLCGNVTWSNNYTTLTDECANTGSAEVIFTATDDCGNSSQTTATFTIIDNTPPNVLTPAADLTVECDGVGNQINLDFWLGGNAGALASDLCGGAITWSNNYSDLSDLCGDTGSATVTFTATDECGNINQTVATFTVIDSTPPSIGIPDAPLSVECDGGGNNTAITNWLNAQGGAGATDLCGTVVWSNDYLALTDECGATGTTAVTFTATDACGNTSQTTTTITIIDTTPPTISSPAVDQLVECDGQGNQINIDFWLGANAGALATDLCGTNITWTNDFTGLSDECGGTGTATVTFTAADECGNTATTTATITVIDSNAPDIGIPASNLVVECDGTGNTTELTDWLNAQAGAGATDLCGNVTWSNNYTTLTDECANTGSAEVTFTATDDCGNSSQTTATFTITDNTAPNILTPAADLTVECDGQGNQINLDFWLGGNAGALASDQCGGTITWANNYVNISDECGDTGSSTVTFTATDECGNISQTTATFIVIDTSPPSIGIPASDLLLECDGNGNTTEITNWLNAQGGAGATDLCGGVNWSNNYTTLAADCGFTGTAIVTFTAADDCGNTSETTASITVIDNTPPVIASPAQNQLVECDGVGNQINIDFFLSSNGGAIATDACSQNITWTNDYTGLSDECGDTGFATVTFTATDDCGNTAQTTATFTVQDNTPPNIGIPATGLTVNCDGAGNTSELNDWLNTQGGAGAIDICGSVTWSNNYTTLTDECGATGSTTVIFTAMDECGNANQTSATFTVVDNTPPTIATPAADLSVECDGVGNQVNLDFWLSGNAGALATDLCSQNITWANNYSMISDDCADTGSATVTFTATDDCGNTAQTVATFTIVDTTAPSIGIPASDLLLQCDGNGNSTEISDWLNAQGGAGALDLCGGTNWSNDYTAVPNDCGATGSTTVTFTVTDDCGNTAQTTGTITIEDNIPPTIVTAAQDQLVECDGVGNQVNIDFWLSGNAGALATDICSQNITWTNDYNGIINDCGDTGFATVTFIATDDCGNTSQTTATFTIQDTNAPSIGIPAQNVIVECDGGGNGNELFAWLDTQAGAGANDLCGSVTWSNDFSGSLSDECGTTGSTTVTFIASDECGNSSQTTATFTIEDNTPPTIAQAAINQTVECDGVGNQVNLDFWLGANGNALATDLCGGTVTWTNNYNNTPVPTCDSIQVVFTATDDCGNAAQTSAWFIVTDNTAPQILNVPADATISCEENLPGTTNVVATDICDSDVPVILSENSTQSTDPTSCEFYSYTVLRTWTATDDCGNEGTATQNISVQDLTAPSITAPAQDQTVECVGNGNPAELNAWLLSNGGAVANDNCSSIVWSNDYSGSLVTDCGQTGSVTVTFTAADICGNTTTTSATFTITDITAPNILGVPGNVTISCEQDIPTPAPVSATDLCDTNVEVISEDVSSQGTDPNDCSFYTYSIARIWLATDDCGNTSTAEQIISVNDLVAPEMTQQAADITVQCDGNGNTAELDGWLANNGGAVATDNCSPVQWVNDFVGGFAIDCSAAGSTTVTFLAKDACGNVTPTVATFTIIDDTAPVILSVPNNTTVSCDEVMPSMGTVTATDLCDTNVEVVPSEISSQGTDPADCGYYQYSITRIWTATDDCGNTASAQQIISVVDQTAPEITQDAQDLMVECDGTGNATEIQNWINNNGGATATDNCSQIVWANDFAGNLGLDCGNSGSVVVTFLAKDACGNVTPTMATFTIVDNTPPAIVGVPANTIISCSESLPGVANVTATDICTPNVGLLLENISTQGTDVNECSYYNYEVTRVWTATDACGNTATASQVVTVSDTEAPTLNSTAQELIVDCNGNASSALDTWLMNNGGAAATDNCSAVTWSNDFGGSLDIDCGTAGNITVTFTATDACGLTTESTATFTVEDNTDPQLLNVPSNISLACSEAVPTPASVLGNDLCDTNVEVTLDENSTQSSDFNDCSFFNYEIIRTWTAIDDCNNTATASQTISVSDNVAPQITQVALDALVPCDGSGNQSDFDTWLNTYGGAVAQDDCSNIVWSNDYNGTMTNDCGNSGNTTVTFTAADVCGNATTTTATFTIVDNEAPILLGVPTEAFLNCEDSVPAPANVTATDLCDTNVEVLLNEQSSQTNNPNECAYYNYQIIRTWTAIDDCGNSNELSQAINVSDNTAPEISTDAQDLSVSCNGTGNTSDLDSWLFTNGGAAASDNCSDVFWTNDYSPGGVNDCGNTGAVTVTFTAADACGNQTTTTANFTITDDAPPSLLAVPSDISVACNNIPGMNTVFATDLCDTNVEVVSSETSTQSGSTDECSFYNYTITRTWIATDDCGNTASASQVITVSDNALPEIDTPAAAITVECDGTGNGPDLTSWLTNAGGATATDDCSTVSWTNDFNGNLNINCGQSGAAFVIFTATDACGNTATTAATLTIEDTGSPQLLSVPVDVTVGCGDIPDAPDVVATDLCDTDVDVVLDEVNFQGGSPDGCNYYNYDIVRTWTATDACGNTSAATQIITVTDVEGPEITSPAQNMEVECDGNGFEPTFLAWLGNNGGMAAQDECSAIFYANDYSGTFTLDCGMSGEVIVTFSAVDVCGNVSNSVATFSVTDNTPPVILGAPNDIEADCDNVPSAVTLLATDLCDTDVEVLLSESIQPVPGCVGDAYQITRTWVATDACGNVAEATQIVNVSDNTPPVIMGVPDDVGVACGDSIPDIPVIDMDITAEDNCDAFVQISFSEEIIIGGCADSYTIVRTWSAVDNCGNVENESQLIAVGNATPPTFTFVPDNITMECPATPDFPMAEATDDCGGVFVGFSDDVIPGACSQSYQLVRTWMATDDCGNTSTVSRTFSVTDNTDPTLLGVPANLTVDLTIGEVIPPEADVQATDACDTNVEVILTTQQTNDLCSYIIYRTWEAVDDCGNSVSATQEITVFGELFATIEGNPYATVNEVVTFTVTPSDPTATYEWATNGGELFNTSGFTTDFSSNTQGVYTITVVITTVDGCKGEASFIIKVVDNPEPIASTVNAPYCMGEDIVLLGEGGNTYLWTGPNGFTSTEQNPTISPGSPLNEGLYTLTVSIGQDQAVATLMVEINDSPNGSIDGTSLLCFGDNLQLLATGGTDYNWTGPNGFASNNAIVNISDVGIQHSGMYKVRVSDVDGCEADREVLVQIGSSLTIEASNNGPLCAGQTLELYATDGADSYLWTGPNGFTSTDQNPVVPNAPLELDGIFTVTATGGTCSGTAITGVEIKVASNGFASTNSPVCAGDDIELFSSGGISFTWLGPNGFFSSDNDPTISNATPEDAGLYTAIVGAGICKDTIELLVDVLPAILVDPNIIFADCDNPGAINLDVSGGQPPYSFDWADLPGNDDPEDRPDLDVGSYSVTIYDGSGCGFPIEDLVVADFCGCDTNAGDIIADDSSVCIEGGSVTLTATSDGNQVVPAGFTTAYVLTQGADLIILDVNTTPSFVVMDPGDYTIHTLIYDPVTLDLSIVQFGTTPATDVLELLLQGGGTICASLDVNGASFSVSEIMAFVNLTTNAECNICNGTASLSPSNYDYEWSDNGTGANRNDLCAGSYNITATDDNGCTDVLTLIIGDDCNTGCDEPNVLNVVVVESSCGESTGSILLELDNPANYVYTWTPNSGTTTGNGNGKINLSSGVYIVEIADQADLDCITTLTVSVGNSDGPVIDDVISSPSACSTPNGSVTILPANYEYTWVEDNFMGNSRSDLSSGPHDVIVVDPANPSCPDIITVQVGEINDLSVEAIVNNNPTCGDADGVVSINLLSGGGPNMTYQWTNGGSNETETNLSAGTYGVFITNEDSGCTFNLIFGLNDDVAPVDIEVEAFYEVSCVGSTDAEAVYTVTPSDDTVEPISETITDVSGVVYTNGQLGPGQYCVVVTDGNGCVAGTACFNVTEPAAIDVDLTITDADCQTLGSISGIVSGGNPSYTFDWEDLPGTDDPLDRTDLIAGTYSLTVTDNNGCTVVASNLVIANDCGDCLNLPVVNSVIIIDSNCDQADGQAIINMTTNFADFSYDWTPNVGTPNAIGNSRANLPAGTYEVIITDLNDPNCSITEIFSISNLDGPQVSVISISPSACSTNNGFAILTTAAGLSYNWSDGGVGPERFDLAAQEYQVTVTDVATGCFVILDVDVPAIDELTIDIIVNTEPDCNAQNGSVTADVQGGSGSYFYSWGADATLDNLGSGVYEVTVSDLSTGCTAAQVFTLNDNEPGATITVDAVLELSCAGANDGFADPLIIYEAGFDNPPNINIVDADGNTYTDGQLGEGTYCILVEDANGCLGGSACFEVMAPTGDFDFDAIITPVGCTTAGSIDLEVTGSNAPYIYNWADVPGDINPPDRFNLGAGNYTVTITDQDGCEIVVNDLVVGDDCNTAPPCVEPQVINVANISSTCGAANGAATITLTGDPSAYTYDWTPFVSSTNTAMNLPSGVYTVVIANANDATCTTEISFAIGNADGPVAEVVATTPATCTQENGTATLSPTGFIFEWCNGGGGFNGINLPAGICFVTVTDPATNCSNILEVEIGSVNLLEATAAINTSPDCGVSNGSVSIDVTGGSANYQYTWSNGGTMQTEDNLDAGIYSVTVTDLGATGCETVLTFVLDNGLPTNSIAIVSIDEDTVSVNCVGDNNGAALITAIIEGADFVDPRTIVFVDADGNTVNNGALGAGDYCILIYDGNDCLAGSTCFTVVEPDPIDVNLNVIPFSCTSGGSISLNVSGGNGGFIYDWADLPGTDNMADRTDLLAGNYSLTITDQNGCTAVTNSIMVVDDCNPQNGCVEPVVTDLVTVEATCGSNNGSAIINLNGNELLDYTYTWFPDVSTTNQAVNIPAGVYMVTIADANDAQCTTEVSFSIGNSDGPQASVLSTTPATCAQTNGTGVVEPTIYIYEWCSGSVGFNGQNLPAGICFVTVTDPATGCTNILEVEIEEVNILDASVVIDNRPDCGFDNGTATILVTGGSANYSFAWSDGGIGQIRNDLAAGVYSVTVTDLGVTGCETILDFAITNDLDPEEEATIQFGGNGTGNSIVNCAGENTGFVDYNVTPGPDFAGDPIIEIVDVDGNVYVNGNLPPGNYCIQVTDQNNCIAGSACFEVSSPEPFGINVSLMNKTCDTLGTIELTVTGGTAPYTYDWADLPGTDDPEDRIGLEAGGYAVVVSDANGCTASAIGLPIVDECLLCPSPDSVQLILPVFTVDSFCVVIESCFDTLSTDFTLLGGGLAGSSANGFWSLDPAGCLFYTSTGNIGQNLDTLYVLANDNGLIDTTCIFVTVVPPCFGLTGLDSVSTSTFDCDLGSSFCLPVSITDIGLYGFTDNGIPYSGGFQGCDFQMISTYNLQSLTNQFPTGPYALDSWMVNGDMFSLASFDDLPQLVAQMNIWDPAGGWFLNLDGNIQGGFSANTYDFLDITHIPSGTSFTNFFGLGTVNIPVGTLLAVDTGYHEIIMTELSTGCTDTIFVEVICNQCPEIYSGPSIIETEICDELTEVCTDIPMGNLGNYLITDNGEIYTEGFQGCDLDTLSFYPGVAFSNGTYTLDSWMVNGSTFSLPLFDSLQQLVDSMNVWDPVGNWVLDNGIFIFGGDFNNIYGEMIISQFGGPVGVYDINLSEIPNGNSIGLAPGIHEVIFTDTFSGCIDTVNIEIACVACNDYTGPGLLFTFDCDEDGQICLDIPIANVDNYVFTDNGLPYVGTLLGCDFDTLYSYQTTDFNTFGSYTVQSWLVNGVPNFLGFFSNLDELTFWMNNVDPGGNWEVTNGIFITGGNSGNVYGNMEVTQLGTPLPIVQVQLQLIPNGVGLSLTLGAHELIVSDTVVGCLDTINVVVQCLTEGLPDTIYLDVLNGFTDTFCIDIAYLPGNLDTIYNFCADTNFYEVNADIFLLDSLACFEFTGVDIGQDTACYAFCDDLGNCDTLYVVIDVVPPSIDTIPLTVILTDTDTICLDVSEIPGEFYTITNLCPGESGDFVLFSTEADTVCILYTGVDIGVDTACYEICDEFGYCDTTILIVETILDPDGIGPVAVDDDTTGLINTATIIDVVGNDTLNGTLSGVTILVDPIYGNAVVNPDFTISYIPNADFCGSLDSFTYILATSSGTDTATVFIDVYCDELTVYTGFSPNEDGVNDGFTILGINNFPNNEVRVFNRWGNEVYLKKGYRNDDPWTGTWNGKDLPDGTYFYCIEDGEGRQYTGYVQLHR